MNITIELADSQRRTVVQASPATNLEQIRIDACAKLRVDAGRYTLAEGTRLLDLNLSLRFAGIRTGSKLILVAGVAKSTPTTVRIALMVNSTREVAAFCPDDSIWAVLLHFNQTQSQCGIPVCIILNREYSGDALQASLKSAGVTSDTSMRLEFRQPQGQSLITENNLKSIEGDENSAKQTSTHDQKLRSEAQNSNAATVLPAKMSEPTVQSNSAKPPMQPSTLNLPVAAKISTLPETKLVETPTDFDRNIHYYSRPISHTPIPIFTAVDDDYTLSSTQLKSLASSMKATTNALVNQPLQTSSMRAASMNARVAKYPFSVIRVKLPDERVLQARFGSLEKGISILN